MNITPDLLYIANMHEFVSLATLFIAGIFMFFTIHKIHQWKILLIPFLLVLVTTTTTVLEEFVLPNAMNYTEHVAWLLSGIAFCVAAYIFNKKSLI